MIHRIEIWPQPGRSDPHAAGIAAQGREMGASGIADVRSARLFFVQGDLTADQVKRLGAELLADPVTEQAVIGASKDTGAAAVVEVHLKPGVMDPVAASAEKAARDMGLPVEAVRTARRYVFQGTLTDKQRDVLTRRLLANAVIEDVYDHAHTPAEQDVAAYELQVVHVPIGDLDDVALEALSASGDLFLNLTEMKAIQAYYRQQGREPTDVELEMLAQTWSEHCVHKTFRSDVEVVDAEGNVVERIPNLIKSTVFEATRKLNKPWCLSVFEDNAGVIEFDEEHALAFKVETHNHPSALDPYGGASTGIGGVVRDPMGTGLGARPVANTDVFCFGDVFMAADDVPAGLLHPRRVMRGVVAGVRDYGNRMGIPTVNGAVYFDDKYLGNPLVFCGTLGLLPISGCRKQWPNPGDVIVVVGGRTGRDGIHGATFSSGEMTHAHETEFSHAVQIGNPITEKKMLDTILQARDQGLYNAITDCGAGGLSSAVGEMGERIGAVVHLDRVPLKYAGLSYAEIWISEAQERMVLAVPPDKVDRLVALFAGEDVEATVIGHFGVEGARLRLLYGKTLVGQMDMAFLHEGLPRPTKKARWDFTPAPTPAVPPRTDYTDTLKRILAAPNVASKEWVIRQYDHEVQGGSVVKPLVGVAHDGPGDAAVIRPVLSSRKGAVLACGLNPVLGDLDPYQSALHAIDEALRNVVAVGGNLERTAILDNFCWGNCNKPDRMGSFVQAAKACRDAALAYGTPFISGKDSLNNEFQTAGGQTITIPPTLLISAVSVIDDVARCVTADAKAAGNVLILVGGTAPQLGGSHYLRVEGLPTGNDVPPVHPARSRAALTAVQKAIAAGLVRACHDLSEGGLAVAASEMAFSGGLGMELDLSAVPVTAAGFVADVALPTAALLFGESAGRLLLEVAPAQVDEVRALLGDVPHGRIGTITDTGRLIITGLDGKALIDAGTAELKAAWQGTFDW
ncbi:MAG: phosphoribosylformylglycinamidine synthase subunit PurL [Planctomycetes bacterium]|nr:phosphoribosylformylglycinamidine synthase subunit PurL [Planctomycetota bacterium]